MGLVLVVGVMVMEDVLQGAGCVLCLMYEDAECASRAVCAVCFASVLSFWLCRLSFGVSSPEPRLFFPAFF
jgi:hypothetical protein